MTQSTHADSGFTLLLIETGLTVSALALAFFAPVWIAEQTGKVERWMAPLVRRKGLTIALVALAMLCARVLLLPWFPAPHPFTEDDFSFLLAADTFVHGRLTNPTPAMWRHLETIHLTMTPTYMSQYFPGVGLLMAAGIALFGHPWTAILLCTALMCAAVCWMLQGWMPAGWALLGSIVLILRIGLFSYWTNTYTGGAPITVLGGALVLGALPRLLHSARMRDFLLLSIGISLLALTRPYEGVLICLPVVAILVWKLFLSSDSPVSRGTVLRSAALPALVVVAAASWLGYYNYRAFGKPTIMPYTIARNTYAVVPYYVWQAEHPTPHYRFAEMQRFYTQVETTAFDELHAKPVLFYKRKLNTTLVFFCGFVLLPPLVMGLRVVRDRRIRYLVWCIPVWIAGMGIGVYLIPHYLAPFTAGAYALGLQAMRHLRVWKSDGKPVGRAMVGLLVTVMLIVSGLRVFAQPLGIVPPQWPMAAWLCTWYGPGHYGADRARVAASLDAMPGKHLVIVRYSPKHDTTDEWVYNLSDVEGARTVWARDMDDADNRELFQHYSDRDIWLVQPDALGNKLIPYVNSASR